MSVNQIEWKEGIPSEVNEWYLVTYLSQSGSVKSRVTMLWYEEKRGWCIEKEDKVYGPYFVPFGYTVTHYVTLPKPACQWS